MPGNFDGIKNRKFGIEIEMTGIVCSELVEAGLALRTDDGIKATEKYLKDAKDFILRKSDAAEVLIKKY